MWIFLISLLVVLSGDGIQGSDYKAKLSGPAWQEIKDTGGIHIGHGRTKRFIQLKDSHVDISYQPCVLPNGTKGHCRVLKHCITDEFSNSGIAFMDYLCIIQGSTIGACCADDQADEEPVISLAGELPAFADTDETDVITKISRMETRGCGVSTRPHGRLTGSRPTNPREWPWIASITPEGYESYCGGVLITDRHVLTAAHCTRRWKAEELLVRLGEYDMTRTNDSRTYNFRVVEKRQHADYEHPNYHHDIAILKLNKPAVFNSYVWPICLPPFDMDLVNESAVIIGWGAEEYGGPSSTILMEVSVPVWPHQKCVDSFSQTIFETNLCAGGYEGGKDACQGDSGGPLMYQMSSSRWATIGVVSWGIRCGEPNHPGVYTRVDKYLRWIVENVQF